jgi:hypothetical protein
MELSGQASRLGCFTSGGRAPDIHCTGAWIDSTAGLDAVVKRKKSHYCPCRGQNPGYLAHRLVSILTENFHCNNVAPKVNDCHTSFEVFYTEIPKKVLHVLPVVLSHRLRNKA